MKRGTCGHQTRNNTTREIVVPTSAGNAASGHAPRAGEVSIERGVARGRPDGQSLAMSPERGKGRLLYTDEP